jgi:hypothetical protein
VTTTTSRSLGANWRTVLLALVVVSLACAPVSWIDDGLTPSWIIYQLILLVGLWRMWRKYDTLYFGIAGTIFLLVHIPFTWAALFGSQSPTGTDNPYNPVQWLITLFAVPLLTVIAGFFAWPEARQAKAQQREAQKGIARLAQLLISACSNSQQEIDAIRREHERVRLAYGSRVSNKLAVPRSLYGAVTDVLDVLMAGRPA